MLTLCNVLSEMSPSWNEVYTKLCGNCFCLSGSKRCHYNNLRLQFHYRMHILLCVCMCNDNVSISEQGLYKQLQSTPILYQLRKSYCNALCLKTASWKASTLLNFVCFAVISRPTSIVPLQHFTVFCAQKWNFTSRNLPVLIQVNRVNL